MPWTIPDQLTASHTQNVSADGSISPAAAHQAQVRAQHILQYQYKPAHGPGSQLQHMASQTYNQSPGGVGGELKLARAVKSTYHGSTHGLGGRMQLQRLIRSTYHPQSGGLNVWSRIGAAARFGG